MTMSRFRLPCVIGHRGAARDAPENTLAAFRLAAAHGAPWVEIDVRRSAEGRCVVFHDETLKRVCGRADRVEDTPLAVLRGLDAGAWFDPAFAGQTIPTLDETLDALAELGLGVVVEIKPAPGAEARLVEGVIEALARRRPAAALLSSFQVEILSQANRMAPDVPRALNARRVSGAMLDRAEELGCVSVHLRHDRLRRAGVARVKDRGFELAVWSVEDGGRAADLWRWGVDAIITRAPDVVMAAWRALDRAP